MKPFVVKLNRAVKPLIGQPGFGLSRSVGLDPLIVAGARRDIVHHVQELVMGSVDEHHAAIVFPSKHSGFLPEVKHEVFFDKIQIVVAKVKANHRHLLAPLLDKLLALFGYPFEVRWHVLGIDIGSDGCAAALQSFIELLNKLCGIFGADVFRLAIQGIGNRH